MDLSRKVRDLLGQLLVLLGEARVRLQQLEEFVGLGLRGALDPGVIPVDPIGVGLVAVGLARLREQVSGAAYAAWSENMPKNRAAFSAIWPKASFPNALCSSA